MNHKINVTSWYEHAGRGEDDCYPEGMNAAIAGFLSRSGEFAAVREASFPQPDHGLGDEVLNDTDVLVWWGHSKHGLVSDEIVEKIQKRVLNGMGLIVLHSAHASKIFRRLMGTNTHKLRWRDIGERERIWTIAHHHPITDGVPEYFDLPHSEMYGECFHIPPPDELVFISWYEGGEVFRSGCTFTRGLGKIFYFSPGHECYPIFNIPEIQRIIINAAKWAAPVSYREIIYDHQPVSPEDMYR